MIVVHQPANNYSLLHIVHEKSFSSQVTFERTFSVPIRRVFTAFTNEKQVAAWWGPFGFTNPICQWNAEINGAIYVEMTSADGIIFPMRGRFHQIDFPSKLVFTTEAFEENAIPQLEVLNTLYLIEENNKTHLTLQVKVVRANTIIKQSLEGMQEGWSQGLDKLEALLSGEFRL